MYKLQHKVKIEWSPNFAYAIGLITSDGFVHSSGRHIGLVSKDLEMVENLKTALSANNNIGRRGRGGEREKKYFHVYVGDKEFCRFLSEIGITRNKSKTIRSVDVPKRYFSDFLRGVFDGDGTFYTFWDKRWPNSFVYQISFASASYIFIVWLKKMVSMLYDVRGFICRGDGVFNIRYMKGDTRKLFSAMYYPNVHLFLKRKFLKMEDAFEKDALLHKIK